MTEQRGGEEEEEAASAGTAHVRQSGGQAARGKKKKGIFVPLCVILSSLTVSSFPLLSLFLHFFVSPLKAESAADVFSGTFVCQRASASTWRPVCFNGVAHQAHTTQKVIEPLAYSSIMQPHRTVQSSLWNSCDVSGRIGQLERAETQQQVRHRSLLFWGFSGLY